MLLPSIYYLEVLELVICSFLVFCTTLNLKKMPQKTMGAHCYYFQQKRIQMTFFMQENELKNIHEHFPTFDQKQ